VEWAYQSLIWWFKNLNMENSGLRANSVLFFALLEILFIIKILLLDKTALLSTLKFSEQIS